MLMPHSFNRFRVIFVVNMVNVILLSVSAHRPATCFLIINTDVFYQVATVRCNFISASLAWELTLFIQPDLSAINAPFASMWVHALLSSLMRRTDRFKTGSQRYSSHG